MEEMEPTNPSILVFWFNNNIKYLSLFFCVNYIKQKSYYGSNVCLNNTYYWLHRLLWVKSTFCMLRHLSFVYIKCHQNVKSGIVLPLSKLQVMLLIADSGA
jgi:hypothetical protein